MRARPLDAPCESGLGRAWECGWSPLSGSSVCSEAARTFAAHGARHDSPRRAAGPLPAQIEIVVPVRDEEAALELSIRRLHRFLIDRVPVQLADRDRGQREHRRDARAAAGSPASCRPSTGCGSSSKGRGRALRRAWAASDAQVVCYMDVDLSTDLRGCSRWWRRCCPATATSRSGPGSRTARAWCAAQARADLARLQPHPPHGAAGRFTDAQCGSRRSAPRTAGRAARRRSATTAGSSTPSCWSSPSAAGCGSTRSRSTGSTTPTRAWIVRTAIDDLSGVARVCRRIAGGAVHRRRAASTLAYALLLPRPARDARRRRRQRRGAPRDGGRQHRRQPLAHVPHPRSRGITPPSRAGALIFVLALALTNGALLVLHGIEPEPPRAVELAVLVAANLTATVTR